MTLTVHFTVDDPTEDTVQSRALTMMAVSSYAVKEKKKKERSKRAGADYDEVEEEETSVKRRVPQLRKNWPAPTPRNRVVRVVVPVLTIMFVS